MTRSRRRAVWAVIAMGLVCLVAVVLAGRERLLFRWKLEQALAGQTSFTHVPAAADAWRDPSAPEGWLRRRREAVEALLVAETRRGPLVRRRQVLNLLAFLDQDLGKRLDLDVLWRALAEPRRLAAWLREPVELVVVATLSETHGERTAGLYLRLEGETGTACQLRSAASGKGVAVRVWELEAPEAHRLLGLVVPVLRIEELQSFKLRLSETGLVSVEIHPIAGGALAPALGMGQTGSPWWDEVILRLFEAVEEPSQLPSRPLQAGDLPPQVQEAMEALVPGRGQPSRPAAPDTR